MSFPEFGGLLKSGVPRAVFAPSALLYSGILPADTLHGVVSSSGEVRVLRSDAQVLVLEYRPRYTGEDTVDGYRRWEFGSSIAVSGNGGKPDLRYRVFPLGFASEQGNSVRVTGSDYEEIGSVRYVPALSYRLKDGFVEARAPVADKEVYGRDAFMPSEVAELSAVRRTRSMLVGNVKVYPVQYNPARGIVRKYTRLVVEVSFGGFQGTKVQNGDDAAFRGVLLNYTVARQWKSKAVVQRAIASSVLSSGPWYRLTVSEAGVYKLDASTLTGAGIDVSTLDPRTIKIYGNGGRELAEDPSASRPVDLVENAIDVEGESDGKFDAGDVVLFYGRGTDGWDYDGVGKTLHHYINHYTNDNYYWLTYGGGAGKRMVDQPSLSGPAAAVEDRFRDAVYLEEEKRNLLQSGKDWVGQNLDIAGSSFTYRTDLPGLVQGSTIFYRLMLWTGSSISPTFTVMESGTTIGTFALPAAHPNSQATPNSYQDFASQVCQAQGSCVALGQCKPVDDHQQRSRQPEGRVCGLV